MTENIGRDGVLEAIDGRPALRFRRKLPHGVERVWKAVSTPTELEQWFPAALEWGPEAGEKLEAYGMTGEVTQVQAPYTLAWSFSDDLYRFELTGDEDSCRLMFLHVFADPDTPAAQTAAGWHTYMDRLEHLLEGTAVSEKEAHADWGEIHEHYAELFGVDPAPGREFWKRLQETL